jgi:Pectinacetylesterase
MRTPLFPWRRAACLALLLLAPLVAHAQFYQWVTVTLPASTGAACGNGTPYRFFVNRALFTRDLSIVYEGGGACWDQAACEGRGRLSASNPNGIPADYLSQLNSAAGGLVTPFSSRLNPFQGSRTQSWNQVYLPYCTGDVHTGSALAVYDDANPAAPRVQYHRGQANVRAAAQWLRSNLGRPGQLLLTGFSAGGVGSTATYPIMRDTLAPTGRTSLLADSGPLFPAPRSGTPEQYPSLPLHNRIRQAWGLDSADGMVTRFAGLPGFDSNNLGSIQGALALRYPQDRFGYMVFGADGNFSAFSYEKFYPEISGAPDDNTRRALIQQRWDRDIAQWVSGMASFNNVAYHVPWFRPFNDSHCLTIIDFSGTGIEEVRIKDVGVFADNTFDRGPPMRHVETDRISDYFRPVSAALSLLAIVLGLFGG